MNIKKNFIIILSLLLIFCVLALTMPKATHAEVVGIWLFDEGKGKTIKDASGNGHDGEIIGAVEWAAGKFESALKFDGGNVSVPHADNMNLVEFTITAWIKVPKIVDPYQMIAGKEAWPNRNYSMWIRPGVMTFGFTTPNAAQDLQVGSKEVTDDQWHFVAGTYDQKNLTPYVDGELLNPRGTAGKPATNTAPFMIGAQPPGGGGPLKGLIDEVAVYNTALSEKEIKSVMEGLAKMFQTVNSNGKLAATWAKIKAE
jgi:hypothetical protein